mgnify:CR=1 FL=1
MLFRKHLFSYSPESKKCGFEGYFIQTVMPFNKQAPLSFKQNTNNSPQSFRRNHRQGVAGVGRSSGQRHRVAGSRASSHEDRQATGLSWREPHPLGVCGWAMPGAERGARVPRARARVDSITGQLSPPVNQGRPAFTACK